MNWTLLRPEYFITNEVSRRLCHLLTARWWVVNSCVEAPSSQASEESHTATLHHLAIYYGKVVYDSTKYAHFGDFSYVRINTPVDIARLVNHTFTAEVRNALLFINSLYLVVVLQLSAIQSPLGERLFSVPKTLSGTINDPRLINTAQKSQLLRFLTMAPTLHNLPTEGNCGGSLRQHAKNNSLAHTSRG
jgi:hypothetical protein